MDSAEGYELLKACTDGLGLSLSKSQWERFYLYLRLLQDWNTRMNLTAITEDAAVITKHFADSLTVAPFLTDGGSTVPEGKTLCDIGTGAGFPGIPLKILFPELRLILVDSLAKRLTFLEEVIRQLGLTGVETVHMRAEDFGRDPRFRDKIDFSTARAVAPMNVLLELCTPPLKSGGLFLAMKGGKDEGPFTAAAGKLSCKLEKTEKFSLKTFESDGTETSAERVIYVFRKKAQTPPAFPRKAGIPSKKPL